MVTVTKAGPRKIFPIAIAVFAVGFGAAVSAAYIFPDQAWKVLHRFPRVCRALFPPEAPPRPGPGPVPVPAAKVGPYTDTDGYAVMSAWKHYWAQKHVVVIRREMRADPLLHHTPNESCLSGPERLAYRDAMRDFASHWPERWALEDRFTPTAEFLIVAEPDLPEHESRPQIPANAGGYFAFSALGFSHDRTRAVLSVVHRDGIYGDGSLWLLRKTRNGEWVVLPGEGCLGWIT